MASQRYPHPIPERKFMLNGKEESRLEMELSLPIKCLQNRKIILDYLWCVSRSVVFDFCDPMNCSHQAPLSLGFPGKNTAVGCHFLPQGIFPTQGLNPCLLLCRQILYHLSYQGSPSVLGPL